MVSTYSSSLRIELIANGEQSGTWGTTTNRNLGTLLEQAITGVQVLTHDNTDTFTLTTVNGNTDQARNMVIGIDGTITANRPVIIPSVNKVYVVRNSTTGGFNLTVRTSGGSGVDISPGQAMFVYCDGTDVFTANDASDTVSSFTIASTNAILNVNDTDGVAAGAINARTDYKASDTLAAVVGFNSTTDGTFSVRNVQGQNRYDVPSTFTHIFRVNDVTVQTISNAGVVVTGDTSATGNMSAGGTIAATSHITAGGNITATGNVSAFSDIALKPDFEPMSLARCAHIVRDVAPWCGTWTDLNSGRKNMGAAAQAFVECAPELIDTHENGLLSLAYGNTVTPLYPVVLELMKRTGMLQ